MPAREMPARDSRAVLSEINPDLVLEKGLFDRGL